METKAYASRKAQTRTCAQTQTLRTPMAKPQAANLNRRSESELSNPGITPRHQTQIHSPENETKLKPAARNPFQIEDLNAKGTWGTSGPESAAVDHRRQSRRSAPFRGGLASAGSGGIAPRSVRNLPPRATSMPELLAENNCPGTETRMSRVAGWLRGLTGCWLIAWVSARVAACQLAVRARVAGCPAWLG